MSRRTFYKSDITHSILDDFYLYAKSAHSNRTVQLVLNEADCENLIFQMRRHLRKNKLRRKRMGEPSPKEAALEVAKNLEKKSGKCKQFQEIRLP